MRKLFFALGICVLFFSVGNAQNKNSKSELKSPKSDEKPVTIYEGKGIEGITVGKSSMNDVARKFGKNYRWEVNKKYSYQMTYDRLGVAFYMCQSDKKKEIFLIEIKSPFKAKTSKGVVLGKTTKEETEKIYGKPEKGFEYRGINFYYNTFGTRRVISEIDVTENAGIRQCRVEQQKITK